MTKALLYFIAFLNLHGSLDATLIVQGQLPEKGYLFSKTQALSLEEKQIFAPEYYSILMELQSKISDYSIGELSQTSLHEEISSEEAGELFGPCLDYKNLPSNDVANIYQKCFQPQFYFIKNTERTKTPPEQYFDENDLEEIYQTAKKVKEKTRQGDRLISLGQSPAYVIEALEEMISSSPESSDFRVIIKIPFSGAPDFCVLNSHYKKYSLSNMVTGKAIGYYRSILEKIEASPKDIAGSDVFIVDLIGSGGSVAAFLNIMVAWHIELGLNYSRFTLLDLSVENRNFRSLPVLSLPICEDCHFLIDRVFVHTSSELSDKLDYAEGEDRIQPPFGPLQWKQEYEDVFKQYPNEYATKVIQTVKEYARKRN